MVNNSQQPVEILFRTPDSQYCLRPFFSGNIILLVVVKRSLGINVQLIIDYDETMLFYMAFQ